MSLPVALQLYSIRDEIEKDFKEAIKKVAEMGYSGVELSGFSDDISPEETRKILDEAGLKAVSVHCPFAQLTTDTDKIIKNAQICGCKFIAIPSLDKDTELTEAQFADTMEKIVEVGKKVHENGLVLVYHNHDFEFKKFDEKYILDSIYDTVPAEYLETELDTCWINVGGENPAEYIKKYAGRAHIVHLKDFSGKPCSGMYKPIGRDDNPEEVNGDFKFKSVGYGEQDMPAILKASEEAGAEWVVVEQDETYDVPSLEAVRKSREYLKSLGW